MTTQAQQTETAEHSAPVSRVVVRHEVSPGLIVHGLRGVLITHLECPVCNKTWEYQVGRKAGFVKAGAAKHVYSCWERKLKAEGLVIGKHTPQGMELLRA